MVFPVKKYERLQCLQNLWQIPQEDLYYSVENGLLRASIWLPLRYVERRIFKDRKFIYETHEHVEGFVGIRPEDTRVIFSQGRAKIREFNSLNQEGHMLRLAYKPPQPEVSIRISDLLVLQEDLKQFEKTYEIPAVNQNELKKKKDEQANRKIFSASLDYRHVIFDGMEFHLGDIQSKIIEFLFDAAYSRNPWVHGKTLMYEAGSTSPRLRDVFKNKQDWRKLIVSNGRGFYRLNLPLEYCQKSPSYCRIEK